MSRHSVILKNYLNIFGEYNADEAITPGALIELNSDGKLQNHATAGGDVLPMFAFEDELQGKDIDEDYASDDPIKVWIPQRGDQVYAILEDGENINTGDFLESAGNGNLQAYTKEGSSTLMVENPLEIVAQAVEGKDLSGSSGEETSGALGYDKRIKVRIV